jgi:hypothetical protein
VQTGVALLGTWGWGAGSRPPGAQDDSPRRRTADRITGGRDATRVFVGLGTGSWDGRTGASVDLGFLCVVARGREIGLAVANGKVGWACCNL